MINRRSDFYSFCKTIWGCFSDENVAVLSNLSFCSVLTDIEEEGDFYFWPPSEGPGHQSSRKTEKSLSLQIITPGAIQVRTNPTGSYACSMHIIINIVNSPVRFHPPKNRKEAAREDHSSVICGECAQDPGIQTTPRANMQLSEAST